MVFGIIFRFPDVNFGVSQRNFYPTSLALDWMAQPPETPSMTSATETRPHGKNVWRTMARPSSFYQMGPVRDRPQDTSATSSLASAGLGPGENLAPQTVQPVDVLAEVPHISEDLGTFHLVTFQGNECSIVDNLQMDDADVCVFHWNQEEAEQIDTTVVDQCQLPDRTEIDNMMCWSMLVKEDIGEFDWISAMIPRLIIIPLFHLIPRWNTPSQSKSCGCKA